MKHAVRAVGFVSVVCVLAVLAGPAHAQEWSAVQKEVWQNVENYWALDAKGDVEGFMAYFAPDYVGWSNDTVMPGDKATVKKFITQEYQLSKTLIYDIKPVAIQVHGNIAFVDYYYQQMMKTSEGKVENVKGRWTDILMKQGDRWVLIGDHGGRTKN
ncbi:MAG: YybH family protein [Acidobacteriota bacterium]